MKNRKLILAAQTGLLAVLLTGNLVLADNDAADERPAWADGQRAQQIEMPEPATLADDICWVAPEWRDS